MLKTANNRKKSRGFTLIEVMLVIAIIAIILSLSLVALRKKSEDVRLNKTALEMQNVMQAAITYINNTGQWPAGYACNSTTLPDPAFINYLPNADYQSNFGANFCWGRDGNTQRFWVALPLPGTRYQWAAQIAAQLPNAYAIKHIDATNPKADQCDGTESTCYLRAEISQSASSNGSGIVAAGYCQPSSVSSVQPVQGSATNVWCQYDDAATQNTQTPTYHINFPCASGNGNVVLTPSFLYMGTLAGSSPSPAALVSLSVVNPPSCQSAGDGTINCTVQIIATRATTKGSGEASIISNTAIPGYVGASYLAYCVSS